MELTHNAVLGSSCDCIATTLDHQSYVFLLTSDHVLKWEEEQNTINALAEINEVSRALLSWKNVACVEHPLHNQGIFFSAAESGMQQTQRTAESKRFRQHRHSGMFSIATSLTKNMT